MGDFFRAITSGVARHVFAWLLPSALTVAALVTLVAPSMPDTSFLPSVIERAGGSTLSAIFVIVFAVVALAVVSAYLGQLTYRILEGYHLPRPVYRVLRRRQMRVWWKIYGRRHVTRDSAVAGLQTEKRWQYPERFEDVMPTRLGNALRAAETYGSRRWNLDTLTVWHELVAVAPTPLLTELDDSRAALDFFAGSLVQFALLSATCLVFVPNAEDAIPLVVALVALLLIWPAYLSLIHRVGEYRSALQALVNLCRKPLGEALGYPIPDEANRELFLWANLTRYISSGDRYRIDRVDRFRASGGSAESSEEVQ